MNGMHLRAVVVFLLMPSLAQAATLFRTYITIAETGAGSPFIDLFHFKPSAALNNNGQVAFGATTDSFSDGIYRGSGGAATEIANPADFVGVNDIALNDGGTVVFNGLTLNEAFVNGLFTGAGGPLTRIVDSTGSFGVSGGAVTNYNVPPDINNSGVVAFHGNLDTGISGLYTGTGGALTTVLDNQGTPEIVSFGAPTINNAGELLYKPQFGFGSQRTQLVTTLGGGTLIADTDDGFVSIGDASMNDSGRVAFVVQQPSGVRRILTNAGGPLSVIAADSSGPLDEFLSVAINNHDNVAFTARYDFGDGVAVFDGADAIVNRVLGTGDVLFGKVITGIGFGSEGFNDAGQTAFKVEFDDGTSQVIRSGRGQFAQIGEILNLVQLTTAGGNSIAMSQSVTPPPQAEVETLSFDYQFLTTGSSGLLTVMIDDHVLEGIKAQTSDERRTATIPVEFRSMFPGGVPDEIAVSFVLSGENQTVRLDNFTLGEYRFVNGDFEGGDFTGWIFDVSGGGSAAVVGDFILIPEPTTLAMFVLALAGLGVVRGRRRES